MYKKKLKALLKGMGCTHSDNFINKSSLKDFEGFGKQYYEAIINKMKAEKVKELKKDKSPIIAQA